MSVHALIETGDFSTAYLDIGTGHPVVLLHGSGTGTNGWESWQRLIPVLADDVRLIVPDFVGFGATRPPLDNIYSVAQWTDQIAALLDALEITQASVIGHSMGGRIAQRLAILHPDRVARLVLTGSASPRPFESPVLGGARDSQAPDRERIRARMHGSVYNPALITDDLVEARFVASTAPGIHEQAEAMFSRGSVVTDTVVSFESLASVQHETLIVHGREDRIVPADHGWDLAQTIPNAELHLLPKCGHGIQIEAAEKCNELVFRHLTRNPA